MIRKVSIFAFTALIAAMLISCDNNINQNQSSSSLGVPTSIATESLDRIVLVSETSESKSRSIVPINPEAYGDNVLCNMAEEYLEPILFNTSNGKLVALSVGYYHLAPGYMICQVAGIAECKEWALYDREPSLDLNFEYFRVPVLIDFSSGRVFDLSPIIEGDLGYGPTYGTALLYDDDSLYFRSDYVLYRIPKADPSHAYPLNNPNIYEVIGTLSLAGDYIIQTPALSGGSMLAFNKTEVAKPLDASPTHVWIEQDGISFNLWQQNMSYPFLSFFVADDGSEWRLARANENYYDDGLYFVNVSFEENNSELVPIIHDYYKADGISGRGDVRFSKYSSAGASVTPVMDFVYCTTDGAYSGVADSYYNATANMFFYNDGYVLIEKTGDCNEPFRAEYTTVSYPTDMNFDNISGDYAYYETNNKIVRTNLFTGETVDVVKEAQSVYSWTISGNTLTYINIVNALESETLMIDLNDSTFTPIKLLSEGMSVIELPELTVSFK